MYFIGFSSSSSPLFAPLPANGAMTAPTSKVTSTATSTAKTFASFLDSTTSFGASPQSTLPSSSDVASEQDDSSLVKYYTSLRGLNVSLLAALTQATQADPFVDISDILNRYKALRLGVQNEFEEKVEESTPQIPAPEKPAFAPPAPPSGGFSGFGGFEKLSSSSSTSSTNNKGGFQPQKMSSSLVPPSSGFSFSIPVQTGASPNLLKEPSPSSPFGTSTISSSNFHVIPENSSSSPSTKPVEDKNTLLSNPFTSGTSSASSEKPLSTTFSFGASTSSDKAPSSAFSFGAMSSSSSSSFSFGKTTNSVSTSFGSTASVGLVGKTNITTTSESSAPLKVPSFGSFGKSTGSTGSIGNPVGFAFGASTKAQESDVASGSSSEQKEDIDEGTQNQTDGAAIESGLGLITKNPHDEEGKGEEDEDTLHDARSKNFKLYSGLKPTQNKKSLTFVGHDETGASQTYTVRLADEQAAATLREALQKEIASIDVKSDD
ncbi:hypothetical protein C0993_007928 [Termitomyces sp. T159_Od127]|nr:hypothetical protein C0993_007928 [Termitomyces sp. T159_Od127]